MKIKHILIILLGLVVLLVYNVFCYNFANKTIKNNTQGIIHDYFNIACSNCKYSYEYLRATNNDDGTINVYVKVNSDQLEKYYHFIVNKLGNDYQLINVNQDIPAYIK